MKFNANHAHWLCRSWTGETHHAASEEAAVRWARVHLRAWKERDDRYQTWRPEGGAVVVAVATCGEVTDAQVVIRRRACSDLRGLL